MINLLCFLSKKEVITLYDQCFYALESTIEELEAYIPTNLQFQNIGEFFD